MVRTFRSMAPEFDAAAEKQGDDLFAAKVDVEKLSERAVSFNIRGLPALRLPHNGKPAS